MKIIKHLILITLIFITSGIAAQNHDENLILSIEFGNLQNFKKEVRALDDINLVLSNGETVLTYSIIKNRSDFVKYLLRQNVDIEQEVKNFTPLMYSAYYDLDILKMLIMNGADLNRSLDGRTAILLAISRGKREAADILRDSGANIDLIKGPDGPYIFDLNADSTVIYSVTSSNQLIIDTINNHIHEVYIRTPVNDSFMFSLREPEVEYESIFEKPQKIFVLSDIEGNINDFITILINNNIVDSNLNWSFGDGHLVLLGDFVDRGAYVTQVLWLIYKLEKESLADGGKVHFLLGNHEFMNIQGDTRYSDEKYQILAYRLGKEVKDFYSNNSFLGRWLRSKNVIEKIGDYIFVHGGISDSLFKAELSIPQINEIVRDYLRHPEPGWDESASLILETYGVLWYRGLITDYIYYDKADSTVLDEILDFYEATNIVIGHCIVEDISTDYAGKVIRVDVDHYNSSYNGIYIEDDRIYKISRSGNKELVSQ